MQSIEQKSIQEFVSNINLVASVVIKYLKESYNYDKIGVNTSAVYLNQKMFCSFNKSDSTHISIKKVLKLFARRWEKEAFYFEEILQLKDKIIDQFSSLCNNVSDKTLIEYIRAQQEEVIELIFTLLEFDKKGMAGEFCKGITNGFEIEVLSKIEYYVFQLLWKPFPTPLPVGIIQLMHDMFKKGSFILNQANLSNAVSDIRQYAQNTLDKIEIKIDGTDFKVIHLMKKSFNKLFNLFNPSTSQNELKNLINELKQKRKYCVVIINHLKGFEELIAKERDQISLIKIQMDWDIFKNSKIPFIYESLELKGFDNKADPAQLIDKIPRGLRELYIDMSKNNPINVVQIKTVLDSLEKFENNNFQFPKILLDMSNNKVTFEIIEILAVAVKKLKCQFIFYIEHFNYGAFGSGNNETIATLATVFEKAEKLTNFKLDFCHGFVTDLGATELAKIISKNNKIEILDLRFHRNKGAITDIGMRELANSLKNMKCLKTLRLRLENNSITDKGLEYLAESFKLIINEFSLELFIKWQENGNKDVTEAGIAMIKNARKYTYVSVDE